MNEEEKNLPRDSFTIGTPATTGAIKIYFDLERESPESIDKKITWALKKYQDLLIITTGFKKEQQKKKTEEG